MTPADEEMPNVTESQDRARIALVTGASRGLGAAIARALAAAGWTVAVNFRADAEGAGNVVKSIKAAGGRAEAFRFDIRDAEGRREGMDAITSRLGPLGLIVNNATGPQPEVPFEQQSWELYADQLDYAVRAPFELLQLVLPAWRARRWETVVNIGSEVSELGTAKTGHYVAAKGAMLAATRSWARELAKDNITVNVVSPGWIPVERHAQMSAERKQRYLDQVPMGRFGTPEEVAEAVVFLASDNAHFITGQRITVNGGRTFQ